MRSSRDSQRETFSFPRPPRQLRARTHQPTGALVVREPVKVWFLHHRDDLGGLGRRIPVHGQRAVDDIGQGQAVWRRNRQTPPDRRGLLPQHRLHQSRRVEGFGRTSRDQIRGGWQLRVDRDDEQPFAALRHEQRRVDHDRAVIVAGGGELIAGAIEVRLVARGEHGHDVLDRDHPWRPTLGAQVLHEPQEVPGFVA